MRIIRPGDAFYDGIALQDDTGAAVNADSTPTGAVYKNGTLDASPTVTVTNKAVGAYIFSFTVPGGYAAGDVVQVLLASVIAGLTVRSWSNPVTLSQFPATALPNVASGSAGAVLTSGTGTAQISVTSGVVQAQVASYASGQTPLQPTVAGRTLDVTSTGAAGIDWSNVENPTTTLALTGTTINSTATADSILGRSVSTVESTASTNSLCDLILASFHSSRSGNTWTVTRTNNSTAFSTHTLATSAASLPITAVS